tara:strand:+ start:3576 stop:3962 length:387 start_codon:yes stop_codon:yes gene_type:complete
MSDIWLRNGILGNKSIDNSVIGVSASAPTHTQLTKRNTSFGIDIGRNYTSVANDITMYNNFRRVEGCRTDLQVKTGRPVKDAIKVLPSYHGVARNTSSVFPRPANDGPLLVPVDSQFIARPNKLGLPK